jgi:ketosteroid isomerase-like protein
MRRHVFLVVAVASLGSTAPPPLRAQGPTPSARSESVRAAEMARRDALLASDTVALSKLVAGEFIEISRLGTIRSRADNMREVASGDLRLLTIKYDSLDVRVYGDVALLTGIADNTGMYRGTVPFSGKIRYTRVFVWRDGRWQAVSMQQTPMS